MLIGLFHTSPVIGVLCMEGRSESGERVLIITAENPDRAPGFPAQVTKQVLERYHLDSYQADHNLLFGTPAYDSVSAANNPPDFIIQRSGQSVSLDCAAFADHHHRKSFRLMQHLKKRLVEGAGGRDFSGVTGCLISIWFGRTLSELPPKRSDDSVIEPLLDAIAACRVDHGALRELNSYIAEHGFPQTFPPIMNTGLLPDKSAGFVANVVADPSQAPRFATGLGFGVQLSRPLNFTESEAMTWLQRIVDAHDQPTINHLLLSAGAPDNTGYRYPAEEAVARFLVQSPSLTISADHLDDVTMHFWFSRDIVRIPVVRRGHAL